MGRTVSILVPAYNAGAYLAETLDSVRAQDLEDAEVIVVDDGSTDATFEIARSRSDVRVERQANAGASATRNRLASLARGDYVQYLDADDVLPAGALRARVAALEASGADVAYSDWQRLERATSGTFVAGQVVARDLASLDAQPARALFRGFWAPPAAWTFRRALTARMPGWNVALPVIQDARYTLDAAFAGAHFVHVPGVGALYRCGHESLSTRDPRAFLLDCFRNDVEVLAHVREAGQFDEGWREALAEAFNYVARSAFALDPPLARSAWRELRAIAPRHIPLWPRVAHGLAAIVGHAVAGSIMGFLDRHRAAGSAR